MKFGIPFGKDEATGDRKGVADIERGLACGCIRPSCGLRLSARSSDEREWHLSGNHPTITAWILLFKDLLWRKSACPIAFGLGLFMLLAPALGKIAGAVQ